jgi:hypothetical protein
VIGMYLHIDTKDKVPFSRWGQERDS